MSAEFYKYATDKIKKRKTRKSSSKRKYEDQNKAITQDPPALRWSQRTKKN